MHTGLALCLKGLEAFGVRNFMLMSASLKSGRLVKFFLFLIVIDSFHYLLKTVQTPALYPFVTLKDTILPEAIKPAKITTGTFSRHRSAVFFILVARSVMHALEDPRV